MASRILFPGSSAQRIFSLTRNCVRHAPLAGIVSLATLSFTGGHPALAQTPLNDSFATAANFNLDESVTTFGHPNEAFAEDGAALGDTRYFNFAVTSPGSVILELIGGGTDRGPITLYDASQHPLQMSSAGSTLTTTNLTDGLYYTSFNVTTTNMPFSAGQGEYDFHIEGATFPNSPFATASLADVGANPPVAAVPESGSMSLLGLGLLPLGLLPYKRRSRAV